MGEVTRNLLRLERAIRAVRVASEIVEESSPGAALRERLDDAVAASLRHYGNPAVDAAARTAAALLDAAPVICAARGAWLLQARQNRRPLVYAAVTIGLPTLAPVVSGRGGVPRLPRSGWQAAVDGASLAGLKTMRIVPEKAAALAAATSAVVRIRRGATPSAALAGLLAGWVWAHLVAAALDPAAESGEPAEPVAIAEYRERRAGR